MKIIFHKKIIINPWKGGLLVRIIRFLKRERDVNKVRLSRINLFPLHKVRLTLCISGARQETDIFVRLIDSATKQVGIQHCTVLCTVLCTVIYLTVLCVILYYYVLFTILNCVLYCTVYYIYCTVICAVLCTVRFCVLCCNEYCPVLLSVCTVMCTVLYSTMYTALFFSWFSNARIHQLPVKN